MTTTSEGMAPTQSSYTVPVQRDRGTQVITTGAGQASNYFEPDDAIAEDADIQEPLRKARLLLRKSAFANSDQMLERDVIKEVVEDNNKRWGGCLMLPVTTLLFIIFIFNAINHDQIAYSHMTDAPLRDWLTLEDGSDRVALEQVVDVDDIWSFITTSFLPILFVQQNSLGEPLDEKKWSRIFQYSQVVGAVEISQLRSPKEKCENEAVSHMDCFPRKKLDGSPYGLPLTDLPDAFVRELCCNNTGVKCEPCYPGGEKPLLECPQEAFVPSPIPEKGMGWYELACHPKEYYKDNLPTWTNYGAPSAEVSDRRLLQLRYELSTQVIMTVTGGTSASVFPDAWWTKSGLRDKVYRIALDTEMEYEKVMKRVEYLQKRRWLDEQTQVVDLRFVILNVDLPVAHVQECRVTFVVHRGGGVFTTIKIESILLDQLSNSIAIFLDVIFIIMTLFSHVYMTIMLYKAARRGAIKAHFKSAVNIFSWGTIGFGWGYLMSIYYLHLVVASNLETKLGDYELADHADKAYLSFELHGYAQRARFVVGNLRIGIVFASIMYMIRTFLALQFQPRLSIVYNTLQVIGADIAHFLVVLGSTMIGFAMAGRVMFGHRLFLFSTTLSATLSSFEVLMASEYDWPTYSAADPISTFIWFVLYFILVVIILLNMVLAIIMDVYQEVRNHAGNTMTVTAHILYIYRRIYFWRSWIADWELLERLSEMPNVIAPHEIRDVFPEMHESQLAYLAEDCRNKSQSVARLGVHPSYTAHLVAAIQLKLQRMLDDIKDMKMKGWMASGLEVGENENRALVKNILSSIAVQKHWLRLVQKHIDKLEGKVYSYPDDGP